MFFKIKNTSQNFLRNLFVSEVFNKNVIFSVLLIIEVELTNLLSKSSGLQRKHPLPPPPQGCAVGGVVDLFIL
jgi:hypothetical protein